MENFLNNSLNNYSFLERLYRNLNAVSDSAFTQICSGDISVTIPVGHYRIQICDLDSVKEVLPSVYDKIVSAGFDYVMLVQTVSEQVNISEVKTENCELLLQGYDYLVVGINAEQKE